MGEFKGTPGPWCLAETESSISFDYDDGPRLTSWQDIGVFETGSAVAIVLGFDEYAGEENTVAEANARLIAAAPDLLEALKGLVALECPITVKDPFGQAVTAHWTEQQAQGHGYAHLYLKALAAIARATGSEAK